MSGASMDKLVWMVMEARPVVDDDGVRREVGALELVNDGGDEVVRPTRGGENDEGGMVEDGTEMSMVAGVGAPDVAGIEAERGVRRRELLGDGDESGQDLQADGLQAEGASEKTQRTRRGADHGHASRTVTTPSGGFARRMREDLGEAGEGRRAVSEGVPVVAGEPQLVEEQRALEGRGPFDSPQRGLGGFQFGDAVGAMGSCAASRLEGSPEPFGAGCVALGAPRPRRSYRIPSVFCQRSRSPDQAFEQLLVARQWRLGRIT